MRPVFATQPLPKSIFLAGPTPRTPEVQSWRPDALDLLGAFKFEGDVFVPEAENWRPRKDGYDEQVHWEWEALNRATVVVFWVPRELSTMPAFTTNVEYGLLAQSGKLVLGYPDGAAKMGYLTKLAQRFHIPVYKTLYATLQAAVLKANGTFGATQVGAVQP